MEVVDQLVKEYQGKVPDKMLARGIHIWNNDSYFLLSFQDGFYDIASKTERGTYAICRVRHSVYREFFIKILLAKGVEVMDREEFKRLCLIHNKPTSINGIDDELEDNVYVEHKGIGVWGYLMSLIGLR